MFMGNLLTALDVDCLPWDMWSCGKSRGVKYSTKAESPWVGRKANPGAYVHIREQV